MSITLPFMRLKSWHVFVSATVSLGVGMGLMFLWLTKLPSTTVASEPVASAKPAASTPAPPPVVGQQGNTVSTQQRPAPAVSGEGYVSIPAQWAWVGAKPQATAKNFTELLSRYSPEQQAYLKKINNQMHGLLNFDSPEEQQWKAERGYPTPEEVLAARNLPLGGKPAYYENMGLKEATLSALRIAEMMQDQKKESLTLGGEEVKFPGALVDQTARKLMEAQSSPVAGFLIAAAGNPVVEESRRGAMVRGSAMAAYLGDPDLARWISLRESWQKPPGWEERSAAFQHISGASRSILRVRRSAGDTSVKPLEYKDDHWLNLM